MHKHYKPVKTLGNVIVSGGMGSRWPTTARVVSDHLNIIIKPKHLGNCSILFGPHGERISERSVAVPENLATKFDRGDAVFIQANDITFDDGNSGTRVQIDEEAVGIVISKETTEMGTKTYRAYRVLVGMVKVLVMEDFMESAV